MTEQMQDHFEKLMEVELALSLALMADKGDERTIRRGVVDASKLLTETTDLLRQDYAQMARAQQAAIDLLTKLRDRGFEKFPGSTQRFLPYNASTVITKVIGLLDGSLKMEEGEDECTA